MSQIDVLLKKMRQIDELIEEQQVCNKASTVTG